MSILGLVAGGVASAGLGAASQALSNAVNWHWQKKQNAFNANEAEKARQDTFYLNEHAAQNADARQRAQFADLYSPQAKMQQIKEANISPALALANGMGSSGQASGAMGGTTGTPIGGNFVGSEASRLLSVQNQHLQNELLKTQIENITADTKGKDIDNSNKQEDWNWKFALNDETIQNLRETRRGMEYVNEVQKATIDDQIRQAKASANLTEEQASEIENRIWKMHADVENEIKRIKQERWIVDKKLAVEQYLKEQALELEKYIGEAKVSQDNKEMWVSAGASVLNNVVSTIADFVPNPNRMIKKIFGKGKIQK